LIDSNYLGVFNRHVNMRVTHRSSVSVIFTDSGDVLSDDKDKADAFNKYYASVGVADNNILPHITRVSELNVVIDSIDINETDILFAISKLKNNLAYGPDRLPPIFFRQLKHSLAAPLSMVFTQLLSVAAVPDEWKSAKIITAFKKGVPSSVSNYRPISLTCVLSKIMERFLSHKLYHDLKEHNVLYATQHGFVKGRSTCSNLLESHNNWTLNLPSKQQTTVIYIDFSKVFDTVSHDKLFARLHSYGICKSLLLWLKHFFTHRRHPTKVGNLLSDVEDLISGVVQGSGIGPLMFLIYINELIKVLKQ